MGDLNYYDIGQRIRKIRKARNLSQEQLAEMVGISVTHMSHIETANTKLSLQVFVDLAEALQVQTDALLYDVARDSITTANNEIAEILDHCDARQAKVITAIVKESKQALDMYMS